MTLSTGLLSVPGLGLESVLFVGESVSYNTPERCQWDSIESNSLRLRAIQTTLYAAVFFAVKAVI